MEYTKGKVMAKHLREIVQLDEAKKKWPDYYIKKETKRSQDAMSKQVHKQGIADLKRKKKIGFFKEEETELEEGTIKKFIQRGFKTQKQAAMAHADKIRDKSVHTGGNKQAFDYFRKGAERLEKFATRKEETEQLDELSTGLDGTLGKYLRKARRSLSYDERQRKPKLQAQISKGGGSVPSVPRPGSNEKLDKLDRKISRRKWGIKKATAQAHRDGAKREADTEYERRKGAKTFKYKERKLRAEETEQLDEGPIKSVKKYIQRGFKTQKQAAKEGQQTWSGIAGNMEYAKYKNKRKWTSGDQELMKTSKSKAEKYRAFRDRKEETEQLDEVKHRTGRKTQYTSLRANVKTKSQLTKEKSGRMKQMKAAGREMKETGEKVKFQKFGNWSHKRAAAKREIQ